VIAFLRFLGVLNAAIWFGSNFYFTFVGAPTFFTDAFKYLFPEPYHGAAAQLAIARHFILNYWCAVVAGLHLAAEWLYAGRDVRRAMVWLLGSLFAVALLGGVWLQPKLKELTVIVHADHYRPKRMPTATERADARAAFRRWHGASQMLNLAMLGGLTIFLWQTVRADSPARSLLAPKFGIDNRS
jgi:hypothetical protein